jgi:hypothetical protein
MSMRAPFVAVAVVVGTVSFVVGCGQTSSSPTSPSSLVPSASSVSDGRVAAYANGPLAHAASSVVHDPIGDSLSPAPYLDIVQAKVTEQGQGTLFFMMVLAGPIPEVPSEPDLIWPFHLDTNPATSVGTDPNNNYAEYGVRVRWTISGGFVGQVVNRTTGAITPVPFSIDGPTVKVFVPLDTLGNPASFGWNAAARLGATGPYVDFAPDGGLATDLATWTQ